MFLWILAALVAVIYYANHYFLSYWSRRNVPQSNTTFLIGNMGDILSRKKSIGDFFADFYKNNKHHQVLGLYFFYRPTIIVNDPQLIQDVLIKDFSSFHDHGFYANENDPLLANLAFLSGKKWRDLRVKMSPVFTSGKLKNMNPILFDCAKTLKDYIHKNINADGYKFDSRDLFARFTTNIISSVAFGIENDCINDPDNIFRKMGLKMYEQDFKKAFVNFCMALVPGVIKYLNIKQQPKEIDDFFISLVKQTIDHRESNKNFERKDLMQLMIQLKNQGFVSVDKDDESETQIGKENIQKLSLNDVAAQAFVFFVAGFETSSSTMTFALFELCRNLKLQKKVQEEIDNAMKLNELTYDVLGRLKYLECVIDETLRKYPIASILHRQCTKDYTFAGTSMKINKGTSVAISVLGLHRDPDIYDDPMEFRPERFFNSSHGNGKGRGVFYLPFGDGPRNCIGLRMGKFQAKLGLATILSKFNFELADENLATNEIEFDETQFLLTPKKEVELIAFPRKARKF